EETAVGELLRIAGQLRDGLAASIGLYRPPNQALEPTPNSFHSCVAPAIGRGSPRALGARLKLSRLIGSEGRAAEENAEFLSSQLLSNLKRSIAHVHLG